MSYFDFVNEIAKGLNVKPEDLLARPKSFVLNTNYRGRKMVEKFEKYGVGLSGKNVIDVGCAYGGMSIEAAKAGARVIGVDVVEKNLNLARINAQNEVDVEFRFSDATSQAFRDSVPKGWADVIILNDVLEHIYDTARLFDNLRHVCKSGAILYYVVPNGMATRFVVAEGHKKVFGISLVPADCWQFFVEGRFSIFYRRWDYFQSLFDKYGLEELHDLNRYKHHTGVERNVREGLDAIKSALPRATFMTDYAKELAHAAVENYIHEAERDLATMTDDPGIGGTFSPGIDEALSLRHVDHKYVVDFWRGFRTFS